MSSENSGPHEAGWYSTIAAIDGLYVLQATNIDEFGICADLSIDRWINEIMDNLIHHWKDEIL